MPSSDTIAEKKQRMRRRHRARRKTLERRFVDRASEAISEHLRRRLLGNVDHVAGYAALGCEVDVRAYLEAALEEGVAIYLPRVSGPGVMEFCAVDDLDALSPGAFGIDEPSGEAVDTGLIEVFLVPGLAFDRRGRRLGFGKGFYDRALPKKGKAVAVGVGYGWQLVDDVPAAAHDRSMDAVVTDEGWIEIDDAATPQE